MRAFGIYKLVRRHVGDLESPTATKAPVRRITPHVFRHVAAVHLLEAGVEVNVIRGRLGHVSLETTNRYAEITVRMKRSDDETVRADHRGPAGAQTGVERRCRAPDVAVVIVMA